MSRQWVGLIRQLCSPSQQIAVSAIASAWTGGGRIECATTADAAGLARRFGMASREADAWARGSAARPVLDWPENVLDLVEPVGLFEEIALDEAIVVLDRLARMLSEADAEPDFELGRGEHFEPALAG